MSKDLSYVLSLKEKYGNLSYKISSCLTDLEGYDVKRFDSKDCFYKNNFKLLDELLDKINRVESELKSKNIVMRIISPSSPSMDDLRDYVCSISSDLNQLENCSKCSCFRCVKDCMFDSCKECEKSSYISVCNKDEYNSRVFNDKVIYLKDESDGRSKAFRLVAIIEIEDDNRFIFLISINNPSIKKVLEYKPRITGIEYGEIKDVDLFDRLVSIYKECC